MDKIVERNGIGKVSVIIPTYNYGRFIGKAIESALAQSCPPTEVIVVDDGSTDETEKVVAAFGERVRYLPQTNQGVGASRNNGANVATGDFLAFLDADDYWESTKLEKQLAKFIDDEEIGLVHCGVQNVDVDGKPLDVLVGTDEGYVADSILLLKHKLLANTIVVKVDIFKAVGGYDEEREMHPSEDWDFIYRVARICKVGAVNEPLLFYRQHGKGGHTNIERMERATSIAWAKAFDTHDPSTLSLRCESYGNLYKVVAGSFIAEGNYRGFMRNLFKSLWYKPSLLGFYLRRLASDPSER